MEDDHLKNMKIYIVILLIIANIVIIAGCYAPGGGESRTDTASPAIASDEGLADAGALSPGNSTPSPNAPENDTPAWNGPETTHEDYFGDSENASVPENEAQVNEVQENEMQENEAQENEMRDNEMKENGMRENEAQENEMQENEAQENEVQETTQAADESPGMSLGSVKIISDGEEYEPRINGLFGFKDGIFYDTFGIDLLDIADTLALIPLGDDFEIVIDGGIRYGNRTFKLYGLNNGEWALISESFEDPLDISGIPLEPGEYIFCITLAWQNGLEGDLLAYVGLQYSFKLIK